MTNLALYIGNLPWQLPCEETKKIVEDILAAHSISYVAIEIAGFENGSKRSARDKDKHHRGYAILYLAPDADVDTICHVCTSGWRRLFCWPQ
jgi:hypothetical protein